MAFNQPLRGKLRAQLPMIGILTHQVSAFYRLCLVAEQTVDQFIGDEGFTVETFVERQSIAFDFFARHGQSRLELSKQTVDRRYGNLPYTEEPQHMVYTIGIEIARHILESPFPPQTSILEHLIPVVGWKAPVLPVHRESVWRCASLSVEVEIFGFGPHVTSLAVHADGDIALEDDMVLAGITMSVA